MLRLTELSHMDRQALQEVLQYVCSHCGLPKWLRSWNLFWWPSYINSQIDHVRRVESFDPRLVRRNAFEIASSTIASTVWLPWTTPTTAQFNDMRELWMFLTLAGRFQYWYGEKGPDGGAELRYYESAASQSIRFLDMLRPRQRSRLRRLVIREDRKCSALPQCHANGLIPYLKDLPRLRVVHHVDMWSAM